MKIWRVRDIMTTGVVSVEEHASYRDVLDLLAEHRISGVPVVDYFGHVTGVVSESDLMHRVDGDEPASGRRLFRGRRSRQISAKITASMAGELMNAPAVTVLADTPLGEAARLLESEGIKRLPVTDELGRLVGIVTRGDVLRVFLRGDDQIRADVVDDVLDRVLTVEPGTVRVTVDRGVVDLAGRMDRRTDTQLAVQLVRTVPGVVDVVNRLTFEFDDTSLTRTRDSGHPFAADPFTPTVVSR
jgi:CBS domain-containing protein